MKTIGELLSRDLGRRIEEVIKVDQGDEQSVYSEITEYVATDKIKDQYHTLLKAIAEAPAEPHEGIGVWVSGFFGSGKSSFAKNLGYVLANRRVLDHTASDLFKDQVRDHRLGDLIDLINVKIPTETILFDVSVDKAVKKNTERVAEIMYTVLLRELGYAQYRLTSHNHCFWKGFLQGRKAPMLGSFLLPFRHLSLDHTRINSIAPRLNALLLHLPEQPAIPLRERLRIRAVTFRQSALENLETPQERQPIRVQAHGPGGLKHQRACHEMPQRQRIDLLDHSRRGLIRNPESFCTLYR